MNELIDLECGIAEINFGSLVIRAERSLDANDFFRSIES